jgi:hypothetical protein
MAQLRQLLKPDGVMLLTIPVGQDATVAPLHRIYGQNRLPRLLEGFVVHRKEYWTKNNQNSWVLTNEQKALSEQLRPNMYGLGCFVLTLGTSQRT